jgi:hypothetical protein
VTSKGGVRRGHRLGCAYGVTFLPEMIKQPEPRRRELDHAEVFTAVLIGVEARRHPKRG